MIIKPLQFSFRSDIFNNDLSLRQPCISARIVIKYSSKRKMFPAAVVEQSGMHILYVVYFV
jgi:hypothetical protein